MLANKESCLKARTGLFAEGDAGGTVYELISGVVRFSKTLPDGRRQIVGFAFPGEIFTSSGFALSDRGLATCTADAVTPIRVLAYPRKNLDDLIVEKPEFARSMLGTLTRSLLHAQQQMVLLGRMSAIQRLVWFLLVMAEKQKIEHDAPLHLPMPRCDIADYLGMTNETVSRVLARLGKNQFVAIPDGSTIRILNWHGMRQAVEGFALKPAERPSGPEDTFGRRVAPRGKPTAFAD